MRIGMISILSAAMLVLSTGCYHRPHHRAPGPPAHAPAHGNGVKHHQGAQLRFDPGLGVYTVIGAPGTFFDGRVYYRYSNDAWLVSGRHDGPWTPYSGRGMPYGLVKKHGPPAGRGHGNGPHPAKARH